MKRRHEDAIPEGTETNESDASALLAPLRVGDRLPWKLNQSGELQWLTVIAITGAGEYVVRYPSGKTETLRDAD
jgi:hypothetical protein